MKPARIYTTFPRIVSDAPRSRHSRKLDSATTARIVRPNYSTPRRAADWR